MQFVSRISQAAGADRPVSTKPVEGFQSLSPTFVGNHGLNRHAHAALVGKRQRLVQLQCAAKNGSCQVGSHTCTLVQCLHCLRNFATGLSPSPALTVRWNRSRTPGHWCQWHSSNSSPIYSEAGLHLRARPISADSSYQVRISRKNLQKGDFPVVGGVSRRRPNRGSAPLATGVAPQRAGPSR